MTRGVNMVQFCSRNLVNKLQNLLELVEGEDRKLSLLSLSASSCIFSVKSKALVSPATGPALCSFFSGLAAELTAAAR